MNKINWTDVCATNSGAVLRFANGSLSRNDFLGAFVGTEVTGQVRRLVRERGADEARKLARKALSRRGYTFS